MIRYGPRRGLVVKPLPAAARIDGAKSLTRGLVACWALAEGAGAPRDLVSGEALVSTGAAARWDSGPRGPQVIGSDGSNGSAVWSTAANARYQLNGARTLACWAQPTGGTWNVVAGGIFSVAQTLSGDGFQLSCAFGSVSFTTIVGFAESSVSYAVGTGGEPHFLVGTVDAANNAALYVDGRLVAGPTAITAANLSATSQVNVGRRYYNNDQCFPAWVDLPTLWNRALTPGEITALYVDSLGSLFWQPRVRLPVATVAVQYLRPASDVAAGTWTPVPASPTTFYDKLDEATADDADYAYSATYPASDVLTVTLSSATDPTSSSGHVVRYRYRNNTGGGQGTLLVELLQGASTVIASWTHTGITSSSWVQANQTLSGAEADSVTDYSTLRLRFTASVG